MKPLHGHCAIALAGAEQGALARLLTSLGAMVSAVSLQSLEAALSDASFLIERIGSEELGRRGWPRERIEATNSRLIHVSVTSFGSTGPRSGWRGSELIASATGGTLQLTGQPDRAPVKEALDACLFHADMVAAAGSLIAHYERGHSGRGQHVDVSAQEVALSRNINSILVWQFERRKLQRSGGALNYGTATVRCIWALSDGWCFHTLMSAAFGAAANQALSDWIDESGLTNPMRGTDWKRYNRSTLYPEIRSQWESAIAAFFRTRSKREIMLEGRRRGIHATVIASPEDVLADTHLTQRGFWRGTSRLREPARFVRLTEAPATAGATAMARPTAAAATDPPKGPAAPMTSVRVLDFSWALVGSITTKVLGDLGAEVIKVESRTRPCLSRIDVQVRQSRFDNFDDKP
jgi:crotonobetainyl-CoA:carnitine CoA-transferase CaiB-like acyl-CoA transferase